MRNIYYRDAVLEALDEEMARDPMVMMIGEDIAIGDGTWRCSRGLYKKYGDMRIKDSPICENGFVGLCVGMALTGMRPIAEIMFSDFMALALDPVANQMSKISYMSGGQKHCPMVVRTTIGAGRSTAAQHSQNLNAVMAHFPGIRVVVPSDAYTAKGLLKSAIRSDDPVIVVEHRKQFIMKYDVPDDADENLLLPLDKSAVVHPGTDATIVASSYEVGMALNVAKKLEKEGISIEVIDLRVVAPLDKETIIQSVKKTGRLLIVDEDYESFGVAAEICAAIQQDVFYDLEAPITRLCMPDVPVPFTPVLENLILINEDKIEAAVRKLL